jgi:dTDP-4-amino-4,6-dideoxygalactose transaminase
MVALGERMADMAVSFVEAKAPDLRRVETLLAKSASVNHWANRGPLYHDLANALSDHAGSRRDAAIVPLANGGVALEAMARLLAVQAGERRRWVASAFSFRNIGRGYFHDAVFLDCDAEGLLDLEACSGLDPDSYDGLIVTNPFGMYLDFSRYADFAHRRGKALLIDNASGFHAALPDWPWQAFSLHHTKPYGFGEGGAALVPREHAEALYALVDYAADQGGSPHWLGNGKLSDVSSAFILERLERVGDWAPRYLEQRQRVVHLAERAGFSGLGAPQDGLPMTSLPLLAPTPVTEPSIRRARYVTLGKYYKPLRELPVLSELFERLVNVPCHPDVAGITDVQFLEEFDRLLETPEATSTQFGESAGGAF